VREIALDLGVTQNAWDAALAEHEGTTRMAIGPPVPTWSLPRIGALVLGSLGIGFATGAAKQLGNALNDIFPLGGLALLVTVSAGLLWANIRRGASRRLQVDFAAWWLPYAAGYAVAYPRLVGDVSFVIALSWAAAAVVGGSAMAFLARGTRGGASAQKPTV
jgi:hypothetical protein